MASVGGVAGVTWHLRPPPLALLALAKHLFDLFGERVVARRGEGGEGARRGPTRGHFLGAHVVGRLVPRPPGGLGLEARVPGEQRHVHGDLQHGVVEPVLGVVGLQQVPLRAARPRELGQVHVGVAQLLEGLAAADLLSDGDPAHARVQLPRGGVGGHLAREGEASVPANRMLLHHQPGGVVGEAPIEQAHLGEQHLVDEGHVLQLLDPHVHLEAVLLLANHKAVHFVG